VMISQIARSMGEVSETIVIDTLLYFRNTFLMQVTSKGQFTSGGSSVLQERNRSFVRPGNRVFNRSRCPSKVCFPAKRHEFTAVTGSVLPFEIFSGTFLLFGGSFPSCANLQPSA